MGKKVLFLGMLVSLSWNAMGIDSSVLQAFENHGIRITQNKDAIADNKEGIGKNSENIAGNSGRLDKMKTDVDAIREDSIKKIREIDHNSKYNKYLTEVNGRNINLINEETEANTDDIVKINEKMSIHQIESDIAIEKIEAQDKAIFEEIGSSKGANAKPIRENKIDKNREMILALESQNQDITDTKVLSENNKAKTEVNETNISNNKTAIFNNSERIGSLEGQVDGLETEMKKGFAMAAAMSSIDFQVLDVGDAGVGFGVGNYKNSDAVSLGVGVRPTENMTLNVKGAMSTGKGQETMVGGGAVYKFNLFGG